MFEGTIYVDFPILTITECFVLCFYFKAKDILYAAYCWRQHIHKTCSSTMGFPSTLLQRQEDAVLKESHVGGLLSVLLFSFGKWKFRKSFASNIS